MLAKPKAGGCWSGECEFSTTLTSDTTRVALSPDGQQAGCCAKRGAYLLRLDQQEDGGQKGRQLSAVRLLGPKLNSSVRRLDFNPHPGEGRQIALASGRTFYILDISTDMRFSGADSEGSRRKTGAATPVGVITSLHTASLRAIDSLAWSPHHQHLLAASSEDGQLNIWDLRQKSPAQTFFAPSDITTNIAWSPFDGDTLATGYLDSCCIWDRRTSGKYLSVIAAEQYQILNVDWSFHDRHKLATNVVYPGSDIPMEVEWDRPPQKYKDRHLTYKSMMDAVKAGPAACPRPYLKFMPKIYGIGAVKIWDTASTTRHHQELTVDRGLPGTAKFLPFGPSLLTTVENCITLYPLDEPTKDLAEATEAAIEKQKRLFEEQAVLKKSDPQKELPSVEPPAMPPAREVEFFYAHDAAVSAIDFARRDANGDIFRILSYSHGDHCLRGWRYHVPNNLKCTMVPDFSPLCREAGSPFGPWTEAEGEQLLGYLTTEAKEVRQLPFVDEVTSYQSTKEKVEYQMCVEVTSRRGYQPSITIGVNPLAPETRRLLQEAIDAKPQEDETRGSPGSPVGTPTPRARKAPREDSERSSVAGLKTQVTWSGDFEGSKDGPLEQGAVAGLLSKLQLSDIIAPTRTGRLVEFFSDLIRRLDSLEDKTASNEVQAGDEAETKPAEKPAERAKLPFPRTCGVCWSPKGHLLFYKSTKNLQPKKGWNSADFHAIMHKSRKSEARGDLVSNEEHGEHVRAAQKMVVDTRVQIIPTSVLSKYVEDHWWTAMAPKFMFEPTRLVAGVAEVCWHNREAAKRIGREDLAEVWRVVGCVAKLSHIRPGGFEDRPFAGHLVRQILLQLFDAQETLTLAMLGCILSVFFDKDSDGAPTSATPEALAEAVHPTRPKRERVEWKPRPMSEVYEEAEADFGGGMGGGAAAAAAAAAAASSSSGSTTSARVPKITPGGASSSSSRGAATVSVTRGPSPKVSVTATYPPPAGPSGPFAHFFAQQQQQLQLQPYPVRPFAPPVIHHAPPPRYSLWKALGETPALSQLIYSAHAHCELMHRLGQLNSSRALAKLLQRLKAYHNLPIMDVGPCRFGFPRMGPHGEEAYAPANVPPLRMSGFGNCNVFGDTNTTGFGPPKHLFRTPPDHAAAASHGGAKRGPLASIPECGVGGHTWNSSVAELAASSSAAAPMAAAAPSTSEAMAVTTAPQRKSTLACELCYLRIQTLATRCWKCGHPFHVKCFREWFNGTNMECPAFNCKCNCGAH